MKRTTRSKSAAASGKRKPTAKNRSVRARAKAAPARSKTAAAKRPAATRRAAAKQHAKAVPKKAATQARPRAHKAPAKAAPVRTTGTRRKAPAPAAALHWTDTLRDGTHVIVRPIGKQDVALERRFIERLSPESRRMRFLGQIGAPSEDLLRRLTDVDYARDMAFIALVHRDGEKQEIGVSRYSLAADGKSCECAVTVSDDWHHRGLATLLMRHLIDVARSRGIRTMVSYDAIDNGDMRELAAFLGFERKADPQDAGMVIHQLDL